MSMVTLRPFAEIYPDGITVQEALTVLHASEDEFFETILPLTRRMRETRFGNQVSFCSIVNAKSGACVEVCNFCSQSAAFTKKTGAPVYGLMESDAIVESARQAQAAGATEF